MNSKTGIASIGLTLAAVAAAYAWTGAPRVTSVNGTAWRNSLADAQTEARRTGKPILLLSMFGKLDEPMPCANARTLRATLFKDPEFKAFVEKEAIPAWEMVRPVPHVTIDFGNGKQLVRTVRGNAVMYLVNPEGKVFDAFPGVYTKGDFLPAARESIAKLAKAKDEDVRAFHRTLATPIPRTGITLGKGILESPTLQFIGARLTPGRVTPVVAENGNPDRYQFLLNASRLTDLSLTPMDTEEVVERVAPGGFGKLFTFEGRGGGSAATDVIRRDSQANMLRTRSVVHYYFASEKTLPTPAQARDAVLGTILKIPYKDPTMGLSEVLLPGTPE